MCGLPLTKVSDLEGNRKEVRSAEEKRLGRESSFACNHHVGSLRASAFKDPFGGETRGFRGLAERRRRESRFGFSFELVLPKLANDKYCAPLTRIDFGQVRPGPLCRDVCDSLDPDSALCP